MKEHVKILGDRTVDIPKSLEKLGIQYDHNVNTITFDCPRYPDENPAIDMSKMIVYINYRLANKVMNAFVAENVVVDAEDPTIIHFDWRITHEVTTVNGLISTLICIRDIDDEGYENYHWNTDLIQKFYVGPGMVYNDPLVTENPDKITQALLTFNQGMSKMDALKAEYDSGIAEIRRAKTEIATKITAPENPKVGKVFRIKTVNEDGTFIGEWADGGVANLDVRINGESIVKDGVAEIPITSRGKPGVVGIQVGNYGLDVDSNNNMRLIGLSHVEIDRRLFSKPLMGNALDYAVKAAMCDGKGAAWTAEEQAAARERMNAEQGSYRLITDMVLEKDTSSIVIDKDLRGEPLSLRTARVIVQHPVPREGGTNNGYVLINNTAKYYGAVDWKVSNKVTVAMVDVYVYGENAPVFATFLPAVPIDIAQVQNLRASYGNEVQYFEKINAIEVLANYYFDTGARIIILGKE